MDQNQYENYQSLKARQLYLTLSPPEKRAVKYLDGKHHDSYTYLSLGGQPYLPTFEIIFNLRRKGITENIVDQADTLTDLGLLVAECVQREKSPRDRNRV